ncbi:Protein ral2 [Smittium culicis]|uniref:Protein ral2 n=1 Tax=Smittium culicis TaxID=133412 RepID=A0A1R1YEH4_9FUNG|nr:Protein ral2 [Smittium culicis]
MKRSLLNDIIVFDTITEKWVDNFYSSNDAFYNGNNESSIFGSNLSLGDADSNSVYFGTTKSKKSNSKKVPYKPNLEIMSPQPRYAHISALIGNSKMIVIGGQGLTEEYIKEYNIFDFETRKWIQKKYFESEISKYRSSAFCLPDRSVMIFSNYNFESIKHEFYKTFIKDETVSVSKVEMNSVSDKPPGIRFPVCRMADKNNIIMSGIELAFGLSNFFTTWVFNTQNKVWKEIFNSKGAPKKFAGSWKESVLSGTTQQLLIFGNSSRSMSKDYKQRRSNFEQCLEMEIFSLGFSRNKTYRSDSFFFDNSLFKIQNLDNFNVYSQKSFSDALIGSQGYLDAAQQLGTQVLTLQQFADTWIETTDGKWIPINSQMIRQRNSQLCESWGISQFVSESEKKASNNLSFVNNQSIIDMGGLASHSNRASDFSNSENKYNSLISEKEREKNNLQKKSSLVHLQSINKNINRAHVSVSEASDVIIPLIKFLYTGILEVSPNLLTIRSSFLASDQLIIQKRTVTILSRLISIGKKNNFLELVSSAAILLCQQVDSNSALLVLDAIRQFNLIEVDELCLNVLRQTPEFKSRKNSFVWNSVSESTRYYVESKIIGTSF